MIIDDTILSSYRSDNGEYSGAESLTQVNETTYRSRGFTLKGDRKLSSWAVELKRIK